MKPSLPGLCHRQTSGLMNTHRHTDTHTQTHTNILAGCLDIFQVNFSKPWATWAELIHRNVVLICLFRAFCQVDGARFSARWEGKRCIFCLALFCTGRRAGLCKWQPEPEDVCWLPRGLLQPAGEVSVAPYGAGKINNERKFSSTAGGLLVSPPNKI